MCWISIRSWLLWSGLFDFEPRRKLAALASDLIALSQVPLPAGAPFTAPDSPGAVIGLLCVIERSILGAQVIPVC